MELTIKDEFREVALKSEDIETWPEMVELFIDALKALGYIPRDFVFKNGFVETYELD